MASVLEATHKDLEHWFFDVYLPHWVEVAAGKRDEGSEFILEYWGTPMFVSAPPLMRTWLLEDAGVVFFLNVNHEPLKAEGYTHTVVPDRNVRVYTEHGGAIEVIWSRRRADESEIQRVAVHFEVARLDDRWKVVGVHAKATTKDTLAEAWLEEPVEA